MGYSYRRTFQYRKYAFIFYVIAGNIVTNAGKPVIVYMKTLGRVLLCLFSPYLMFFIIANQQGILSYQIRQLPCRARGAEHETYVRTYRSAWTVLYMETCFSFR